MSVVSGTQMASAQRAWTNPYALRDDESALGDSAAGWKHGETPASLSAGNLTGAQKQMAWRTPGQEALGVNTVGSWYGFGPSWHERYKSD